MSDDGLQVNEDVIIPRSELVFRATRAGGPGGQHVNTSSTRIELLWDVVASSALEPTARDRVAVRLASRMNAEGHVRVVSSEHRSQLRNREAAEQRLAALVRAALVVPRARRKTRPTRAGKAKRLDQKKRQSKKKQDRRWRGED